MNIHIPGSKISEIIQKRPKKYAKIFVIFSQGHIKSHKIDIKLYKIIIFRMVFYIWCSKIFTFYIVFYIQISGMCRMSRMPTWARADHPPTYRPGNGRTDKHPDTDKAQICLRAQGLYGFRTGFSFDFPCFFICFYVVFI